MRSILMSGGAAAPAVGPDRTQVPRQEDPRLADLYGPPRLHPTHHKGLPHIINATTVNSTGVEKLHSGIVCRYPYHRNGFSQIYEKVMVKKVFWPQVELFGHN